MKFRFIFLMVLVAGFITACQKEFDSPSDEITATESDEATFKSAKVKTSGYVHGIEVDIDGELYYFAGADDGVMDAFDIPGHTWVQAGKNRVVGKHYNTGPFGMEKWWSSDAPDGALLYKVNCIIDTWSEEKAAYYASKGYVHYHEFISVEDGSLHPTMVPWLKHTAVTSFTLDGGPAAPFKHDVSPGVDLEFPNNYLKPYNP